MNLNNILKVLLLGGFLSLSACEDEGPSLIGAGGGSSVGGWTLNFSRQDFYAGNGISIRAQCVSNSSSISLPPSANSNKSLTCDSGDSIKIEMLAFDVGDRFEEFEIGGVHQAAWLNWDWEDDPMPSAIVVHDSQDGGTVLIKANQIR